MSAVDELWAATRNLPHIDANALARAVENAVAADSLDYRSRLLVRDSVRALETHWGKQRFQHWLNQSPNRDRIELAYDAPSKSDEVAFPYLASRVMDAIQLETVLQLLRELSGHLNQPTRIVIGGSIALVL